METEQTTLSFTKDFTEGESDLNKDLCYKVQSYMRQGGIRRAIYLEQPKSVRHNWLPKDLPLCGSCDIKKAKVSTNL